MLKCSSGPQSITTEFVSAMLTVICPKLVAEKTRAKAAVNNEKIFMTNYFEVAATLDLVRSLAELQHFGIIASNRIVDSRVVVRFELECQRLNFQDQQWKVQC